MGDKPWGYRRASELRMLPRRPCQSEKGRSRCWCWGARGTRGWRRIKREEFTATPGLERTTSRAGPALKRILVICTLRPTRLFRHWEVLNATGYVPFFCTSKSRSGGLFGTLYGFLLCLCTLLRREEAVAHEPAASKTDFPSFFPKVDARVTDWDDFCRTCAIIL